MPHKASVLVTDNGFSSAELNSNFISLETLPAHGSGLLVDVPADTDPQVLSDHLPRIDMIRVHFASFADGRGFTIAKILRSMGYKGRLRAEGHVIADQYAMARRSGFDEVEINDELATRQPEAQWCFRADWQVNDYQKRLRSQP